MARDQVDLYSYYLGRFFAFPKPLPGWCSFDQDALVCQASYPNPLLGLTADDNIVFVLCREERKWRKWVDNTFVHTLSPNIYRTASEAMQAFEYFSKQSNFGTVEKYTTYLAGPVVMYFVGKHVKNKYVIVLHYFRYTSPSTLQVSNLESHNNELESKSGSLSLG